MIVSRYAVKIAIVAVAVSFVGLLSIGWRAISAGSQPPQFPDAEDQSSSASCRTLAAEAIRRAGAVEALAQRNPFTAFSQSGRESMPSDGVPSSVGSAWAAWKNALARAEQFARISALPTDSLDTKTQLQHLLEDLRSLRADVAGDRGPATARWADYLDRQIASVSQTIADIERRQTMQAQLDAISRWFAQKDYDRCVQLCDEFLVLYRQSPDRDLVQQVELLRAQAASQVEQRLAAQRAMASLRSGPPQSLLDAVVRAEQIASAHPLPGLKAELQAELRKWIEGFIPSKQSTDPPDLQELVWESSPGEPILSRGFVKEVTTIDGRPGYQVFKDKADLDNPRYQTGTIPKSQVTRGPAESLPRQCVDRYHAARQSLLRDPWRMEHWDNLAAVCRELQAALEAYRQEPGHGDDPVDFAREAALLEELLQGEHRAKLEAILSP